MANSIFSDGVIEALDETYAATSIDSIMLKVRDDRSQPSTHATIGAT